LIEKTIIVKTIDFGQADTVFIPKNQIVMTRATFMQ